MSITFEVTYILSILLFLQHLPFSSLPDIPKCSWDEKEVCCTLTSHFLLAAASREAAGKAGPEKFKVLFLS